MPGSKLWRINFKTEKYRKLLVNHLSIIPGSDRGCNRPRIFKTDFSQLMAEQLSKRADHR